MFQQHNTKVMAIPGLIQTPPEKMVIQFTTTMKLNNTDT